MAMKSLSPPEAAAVGANLLEGLGDHHFPVTSRHPDVQRWFDQGLMLSYGFNHDAAERSFLKATGLDPECAMCWWGATLVVGPHVNAGMDPRNNARAWARLQKARVYAPQATERERAFITALSSRYAENPPQERKPLDEAYAAATRELMQRRPDDLDAATLHAEALMDLQPWAYYDEARRPVGNTNEIVSVLESVMARNPDHPGALHLYVHAVEASADPQRGVPAADRLRTLIPGSGHLVHMPAHIYARVGRWHDAVIAALRETVVIEDRIPYDEPPGWHAPVRQALAAQLLVAKRPDAAEAVYREELRRNPANGWSLLGLAHSLKAQRRAREAAAIERQVAQIWKHHDVPPLASKY